LPETLLSGRTTERRTVAGLPVTSAMPTLLR
jgi:hypothetical protein